MKTLFTFATLLVSASLGFADQHPFVALEHIAAEDAVQQAQTALGKEIENVTVVADAKSNRVYVLHENPRAAKLIRQFLRAIDLPGETLGMTFVALNYVAAEDALQALWDAFGEEPEEARAVVCKRSNRVLIGGTKAGRHRLERFLIALDRQPRQVQLRAIITKVEKGENGREKRTVLSQPTIMVQDGKGGIIMTGEGEESLEVRVSASVVDPPRAEK